MSKKLRRIPTRGRPRRTFLDAVLAGEAFWYDIDDWIDRWHESDTDIELHTWLGMSWDEYATLGAGNRNIGAILHSRKTGIPLNAALALYTQEPVAARGKGDDAALHRLLKQEKLLDP